MKNYHMKGLEYFFNQGFIELFKNLLNIQGCVRNLLELTFTKRYK